MKLFILRLCLLKSRMTSGELSKGFIQKSSVNEKRSSRRFLFVLFNTILMTALWLSCASANAQTMKVTATSATTFNIQINSDVYSWRVDEYVNGTWQELVRGDVFGTRSFNYTRPAGGTFTFHLYNCYNVPNSCTTSSSQSVTLTGNTPPSPPTVSTGIGNGSVVVNWNAPTGATSYQLSRNGTSLSPATSPYTDTGVSPGTSYTYSVIACNAIAQCSTAGTSTIVYPAIPAVPSISSTMNGANVVLTWVVPAGATSMQLLRGTTPLPALSSPYTDTGVSAGSTYTYTLKACNAASMCSAAGSTTINIPPIPAPPTVTANFGGATATVTWTNPTGTTSFQVQRNGSNVGFTGTSYYDNQLTSGNNVTYTVKACNVNNQCSAAGSATVVVPSGPLFQVDVTGNNSFRITVGNVYSWNPQESTDGGVSWNNLASGSATSGITSVDYVRPGGNYSYRLYNCYNVANGCSTSSPKSIYLAGNPPPATPSPSGSYSGSTITISWNQPSGAVSYNVTRDGVAVTPTGASYIDSISAAGSVHTYTVKACNSTGECSAAASITYGLPPVAPTVTPTLGNASVIVNWSASSGATSYQVSRGTTVLAGPSPAYTSTSLTDSSVVAGTTYTYSVLACNSLGQCSTAGTGSIPYPAVPSVTTFGTAVSGATVVASWTVSAGTHHVQLYRDTNQLSVSSSPYTDAAIVAGNSYTYKLAACNAANVCSAFSFSPISVAAIPAVPTVGSSFAGVVATITWNTPPGTTSFQVQRNGSNIGFSGNSLADSLSAPGTYTYTVKACNVNNQCSAAGNTQVVVPSGPMFQVDVTGNNTFRLLLANVYTWELQQSGDGGVNWSRADAGGTFNGVSQFTYTRPGGSYFYRIYNCYNVSGCGYTAPQSITLQGTPAPAAPTISASISGSNINVSWTDTGYSYQFYRRLYPAAFVSYTASSRLAFSETGVAGASYQYGVQACNVTGECSAISRVDISKIANPSGVSATLNPRTAIVVASTAAVTGATQYNVQRQLVGSGTWTTVYSGPSNAPSLPVLTTAGSYIYQIQACNTPANDCSPWVQTNSITAAAPTAPTLTLPPTSSANSFTLSWGDVPNAASYTITEFTNGTQTNTFSQAGTTYAPTGKANATYTYQVYATNPISSSATASASITVAAVGAMGAVTATLNSVTGVTSLSWAGVSGATRYNVQPQLNGANSGAVQSFTTNSASLPAISAAGTYTYVVTACAVVSSYTNCGSPVTSNSVVLALPAAPTLTLPASTTTDSYTLSWVPINNAGTYVVNESKNNVPGTDSAPISATSQAFTGKPDAYYDYKVKACNLLGCGPYSAASRVRVLALGTLGTVTATMNGATGVATISWAPVASTQYSFRIMRNGVIVNSGVTIPPSMVLPVVTAAGTYTYSVYPYAYADGYSNGPGNTVISNPVILDVPPATPAFITPAPTSSFDGSYSFGWNAVSNTLNYVVNENGVDVAPAITSPLTFSRTGKGNGTNVYKVKACNVVGCTAYGPSISIDVAQVGFPTGVVAALDQTSGVPIVTWNAATNADSYWIQPKLNGNNVGTAVKVSAQSASLPPITAAGKYTYGVKACATVGTTTNCSVESISNELSPFVPDAPGIYAPFASSTGAFSVSWTMQIGATRFELYENNAKVFDGFDRAKTFNLLEKRTSGYYMYQVRACKVVCGPLSEPVFTMVTISQASTPQTGGSSTTGKPGGWTGGTGGASSTTPQLSPLLTNGQVVDLADTSEPTTNPVGIVGAQFRVNESGAASYTVPIVLPDGIAGVTPHLSLVYSSQSGNGLLGKGWSIGGLSAVSRCHQTLSQDGQAYPISWSANDRYCLDGQRLMLQSGAYGQPGSTYKTEIDTYVLVTAVGGIAGHPDYFDVEAKDGSVTRYGDNGASDSELGGTSGVVNWNIKRFKDNVGNLIVYVYEGGVADYHIKEVRYGYSDFTNDANYGKKIAFQFDARNDAFSTYVSGSLLSISQRLATVSIYNSDTLVKSFNLGYEYAPATIGGYSRLTSVKECSSVVDSLHCLPPTTFKWNDPTAPGTYQKAMGSVAMDSGKVSVTNRVFLDINGNGIQDYLWADLNGNVRYSLDPALSNNSTPYSLDYLGKNKIPKFEVIDYNADGHQDLLMYRPDLNKWVLYLAVRQPTGWGLERQTSIVLPFEASKDIKVGDINSDGLADIIVPDISDNAQSATIYFMTKSGAATGSNLYYQFDQGNYRNVLSSYNVDLNAYRYSDLAIIYSKTIASVNAFADYNGDGKMDLLATVNHYAYYDSDGVRTVIENSFTTEVFVNTGTEFVSSGVIVKNDNVGNIVSPDLNGDGLQDIAYLVNKKWSYRLNTGSGFSDPAYLYDVNDKFSKNQNLSFADINHDGFADVVWRNSEYVVTSPGVYSEESQTFEGVDGAEFVTIYVKYWNSKTGAFGATSVLLDNVDKNYDYSFADLNGDTWLDEVATGIYGKAATTRMTVTGFSTSGDYTVLGYVGPDQISKITDGLGNTTQISYASLGRSDHYYPIDNIKVVDKVAKQCHPEIPVNYTSGGYTIPAGCTDVVSYDIHTESYYSALNDPFYEYKNLTEGAINTNDLVDAPILEVTGPVTIVTSVQSSIPAASEDTPKLVVLAQNRVDYYYEHLRMQAAGRGLLGFEYLTAVDMQTGVKTKTRYRQDWPYIGSAQATNVTAPGDKPLRASSNVWTRKVVTAAGTKRYMPVLSKSIDNTYSLYSTATTPTPIQTVITETAMTPDDYGNVDLLKVTTQYGSNSLIKTTDNDFTGTEWEKRMGRLTSTTVTTKRNSESDTSKKVSFTYYPKGGTENGLLHTELLEEGTDKELLTVYSYDQWGHKTQVSVTGIADISSKRRETRTTVNKYTSDGKDLLSTVTGEGDMQQEAQITDRDPATGQPKALKDINNVAATIYYDNQGKEFLRTDGTGAWKRTDTMYCDASCPAGATYFTKVQVAGGGKTKSYYDSLGRMIRSSKVGFDGTWINTDTEYDLLGRVKRQTTPYFETNSPAGWTTYEYDLLGQPTKVTMADGSKTTTSRSDLAATITNDLGHSRTETHNALGQLVGVTEDNNTVTSTINYEYNADGNLLTATTSATDAGSVTVRMCYDSMGRKTGMIDPDKGGWLATDKTCSGSGSSGWWTYAYNAFGELVYQKDAKGQITTMQYDVLGRMIKRVDEDVTRWYYDKYADGTSTSGMKGKLAETAIRPGTSDITGYDGADNRTLYTYDIYGRLTSTGIFYPNDTNAYITQVKYDSIGRAYETRDALNGLLVTDSGVQTQYNQYGYAVRTVDVAPVGGGNGALSTILSVNERGQVVQELRGNGVTTTNTYNATTGSLEQQYATNPLGAIAVQDENYRWDTVGNLKYRQNKSAKVGSTVGKNLAESFCYDGLNRLTTILKNQAVNTINCGTTPDVEYDGLGNITKKVGVGTYSYAGTSAGPHAVTSVSGQGSYTYDANGNVLSDPTRNYTYTAYDMAKTISKSGGNNVSFTYGADHARWKRVDSVGAVAQRTTLYIGNLERVQDSAGNIEWRRNVGGVVFTYKTSGTSLSSNVGYLYVDHLGSLDVITNGVGKVTHSMSFDPWGARRDGDAWTDITDVQAALKINGGVFTQAITQQGFTGHEMLDDEGIIHMNGRIYDPKLGRFLQADPHVDGVANTQGFNRYSYVQNNPLNATDPTGYFSLRQFVGVIVAAVATYVCYGYAACGEAAWAWIGAASGAAQAAATGGNVVQGALTGLVTSMIFHGIGQGFTTSPVRGGGDFWSWTNEGGAGHIFAHAFAGGMLAQVQGGNFGSGFISAGITKGFDSNFDMHADNAMEFFGETAIVAVVGGTVSQLSGGKFANGAFTASFQHLFNEMGARKAKELAEEEYTKLGEKYEGMVSEYLKCNRDTSGLVIDMSGDEMKTMLRWKKYFTDDARLDKYEKDDNFITTYVKNFVIADTFLWKGTSGDLTSIRFRYGGEIYSGGNINYLAVGMMAARYHQEALLPQMLTGWNGWQYLTQGFHTYNLKQIYYGGQWALFGAAMYHNPELYMDQ